MIIRAKFDKEGRPNGFYASDIDYRPEDLEGTVEITHEQWQEFLDHQGQRRWDGEKVVECVPKPFDQAASEQFWNGLDAYHLALGRFISKFSEVESSIFLLLMLRSGLSLELLNCLVPPQTSLKTVIDKLKSITSKSERGLSASFERNLRQLEVIRLRRNTLLHTGPRYDGKGSSTAVDFRKPRSEPWAVNPEVLDQMTNDLTAISAGIAAQMLDGIASEAFLDEGFRPASEIEWQYKGP